MVVAEVTAGLAAEQRAIALLERIDLAIAAVPELAPGRALGIGRIGVRRAAAIRLVHGVAAVARLAGGDVDDPVAAGLDRAAITAAAISVAGVAVVADLAGIHVAVAAPDGLARAATAPADRALDGTDGALRGRRARRELTRGDAAIDEARGSFGAAQIAARDEVRLEAPRDRDECGEHHRARHHFATRGSV